MISILIPTIRPENIPALTKAIYQNAGLMPTEYEIIWEYDRERIGCPRMLKNLVKKAKGDKIAFIGDDTIPCKDFLKNALAALEGLPDGIGVVAFNSQQSRHAAHFLASRAMLEKLPDGEFFSTDYHHCFCDNELTDIAIEQGRFTFCDDAKLIHNHPAFQTVGTDPDYDRVYSPEFLNHDRKTYYKRKRKRFGFKLGIGWPIVDKRCHIDFTVSFVTLEKPDFTLLVPKFATGDFPHDIAAVRNNLVLQALHEGCSHLLMMDTDQIYRTRDMIPKMLSHDKAVIGAPVHRRYPPFDAILYRGDLGKYKYISDDEVYSGDLLEVDATGTGCILIQMDVFDFLDEPYFRLATHAETGKPIGEDIGFCSSVRGLGIPIYVDTSIIVGHMTDFEVNRQTYELFKTIKGFRKAV
jgi:hypothetical protein